MGRKRTNQPRECGYCRGMSDYLVCGLCPTCSRLRSRGRIAMTEDGWRPTVQQQTRETPVHAQPAPEPVAEHSPEPVPVEAPSATQDAAGCCGDCREQGDRPGMMRCQDCTPTADNSGEPATDTGRARGGIVFENSATLNILTTSKPAASADPFAALTFESPATMVKSPRSPVLTVYSGSKRDFGINVGLFEALGEADRAVVLVARQDDGSVVLGLRAARDDELGGYTLSRQGKQNRNRRIAAGKISQIYGIRAGQKAVCQYSIAHGVWCAVLETEAV